MYTPFTSRHFTTHIDPQSKMKYAVLTTRVAPIQQGFYFVNSGFSDDGRYLWFYCAFPPAVGHSLGVVDFLTDEVRHFPDTLETQMGASWMVDGPTGNVYWGCSKGIFMRTPHPEDSPVMIAPMPELFKKARVSGIGTHLTFTPDRKELLCDMQSVLGSSIGSFNVVTGEYIEWYRTPPGVPYNHVQANPVNPDLCMAAHEYSYDPIKGEFVAPPMDNGVYPRLQIISRDGTRRMLPPYGNSATHEWWAPDGKSVFYCNMQLIARNRLDGGEPELICKVPIEGGAGVWHAHCTRDEKYFILDGSWPYGELSWWRGCESMVRFYNAETGKIVPLITRNPIINGYSPENECTYHIDCHPRFVLNDTMVTFTTTMQGHVDVGVAEVQQLINATK